MDESLNQLVYLFDTAKNFSDNMKNSFFITLVPTIIAVGGTLFLGWGITSSVILYYAGLAAGMGNSMLPLMTDERKESGKQAKPQLGLVTQG